MEELEPSRTADGNVTWCSHFGKHLRVLKSLNTEFRYDLATLLLRKYTREMITYLCLHKNFLAAYL